jgi:hypothetical protein
MEALIPRVTHVSFDTEGNSCKLTKRASFWKISRRSWHTYVSSSFMQCWGEIFNR